MTKLPTTRFRGLCATRILCTFALTVLVAALSAPAFASTLEIQLGGVDIGYDGAALFDSDPGSSDPDPLNTVTFLVDNVVVGSVLTTDITLDMFIPGVTSIPDTGGFVVSAAGGMFDLGLPAADFLDLDLGAATISYINLTTIQFTFGGSVASIDGQSLPFGLEIGSPVTVSFSTQVNGGSLVTSGGFVDEFTASGTGEIFGTLVPEPASIVLGTMGAVALVGIYWRRRTR